MDADDVAEVPVEPVQLGLLPPFLGGVALPAESTSFIAARRSMVFFTVVFAQPLPRAEISATEKVSRRMMRFSALRMLFCLLRFDENPRYNGRSWRHSHGRSLSLLAKLAAFIRASRVQLSEPQNTGHTTALNLYFTQEMSDSMSFCTVFSIMIHDLSNILYNDICKQKSLIDIRHCVHILLPTRGPHMTSNSRGKRAVIGRSVGIVLPLPTAVAAEGVDIGVVARDGPRVEAQQPKSPGSRSTDSRHLRNVTKKEEIDSQAPAYQPPFDGVDIRINKRGTGTSEKIMDARTRNGTTSGDLDRHGGRCVSPVRWCLSMRKRRGRR